MRRHKKMATYDSKGRLQKKTVCRPVILRVPDSSTEDTFLVQKPCALGFSYKRLTLPLSTPITWDSALPWEEGSRGGQVQTLLCFTLVRTKPTGCWRTPCTLERVGCGDRRDQEPLGYTHLSPVLLIKLYFIAKLQSRTIKLLQLFILWDTNRLI